MRAVLCLALPAASWSRPRARGSAPDRGDAGSPPGSWTGDPATGFSWVLPAAPTWDLQVRTACARLAELPGIRSRGAGLAQAPFPAACAARLAAPGTLRVIAPGQEAPTLAPLPVSVLPGLPAAQGREFQALRVLTLGDLAALPSPLVASVFGAAGLRQQALARGLHPGPGALPPPAPPATALRACLALAPGVARRGLGPADLAPLTERLAADLAAVGRAASSLTATVGFVDGSQATRTARLVPPIPAAEALLGAAWPLMVRVLRARRCRPAWLALAVPHTTLAALQLPLPLPAATDRVAQLATALVTIQQRFGPQAIGYGHLRS